MGEPRQLGSSLHLQPGIGPCDPSPSRNPRHSKKGKQRLSHSEHSPTAQDPLSVRPLPACVRSATQHGPVSSTATDVCSRCRLASGAKNLDPEGPCGDREATVVRCYDQFLPHPITPDQRRGEVYRIKRAERCREGLSRPCKDGPLEEDQVDGFQPVVHRHEPERRLLRRERTLKAQAIDRPGHTRRLAARSK